MQLSTMWNLGDSNVKARVRDQILALQHLFPGWLEDQQKVQKPTLGPGNPWKPARPWAPCSPCKGNRQDSRHHAMPMPGWSAEERLGGFPSWHVRSALSRQARRVVLGRLVLLGALDYLDFQVAQAARVHPVDKEKKDGLDLRTDRHTGFWNPALAHLQASYKAPGKVRMCALSPPPPSSPSRPFNTMNKSGAAGRRIPRLWSRLQREEEAASRQSRRRRAGLPERRVRGWNTGGLCGRGPVLCWSWMSLLRFPYQTETIQAIWCQKESTISWMVNPGFCHATVSVASLRNFHLLFPKIPLIGTLFILCKFTQDRVNSYYFIFKSQVFLKFIFVLFLKVAIALIILKIK